jgi:hypothetical protein
MGGKSTFFKNRGHKPGIGISGYTLLFKKWAGFEPKIIYEYENSG